MTRLILAALKRKPELVFASSSSVLLTVIALGWPWLLKILVDDILIQGQYHLLPIVLAGLGGTGLLLAAGEISSNFWYTLGMERILESARLEILVHALRVPLNQLRREGPGELIGKLNSDMNSLSGALRDAVESVLIAAIHLVILLAIIVAIDWRLGLVSIAIVPLYIAGPMILRKQTRSIGREAANSAATLISHLTDYVRGSKDIWALSQFRWALHRVRLHGEIAAAASGRRALMGGIQELSNLVYWGSYALVWIVLAERAVEGEISIGVLLALTEYITTIDTPSRSLAGGTVRLLTASGAADRIAEFLASPKLSMPTGHKPALLKDARQLEVESVGLLSPPGSIRISDATFTLRRGNVLWIVGPSGGGKSSLLQILARLEDSTNGSISIDGELASDFRREDWSSRVGYSDHEAAMVGTSVSDIVTCGYPSATVDDVIRHTDLARARDFILALPNGYDTDITSGPQFSTGEYQRLSIARATIRRPSLLLLDEAMSALDKYSEQQIMSNIRLELPDTMIVSVTHRISSIPSNDIRLFISEGRVVDSGTHTELLNRSKLYATFCRSITESPEC